MKTHKMKFNVTGTRYSKCNLELKHIIADINIIQRIERESTQSSSFYLRFPLCRLSICRTDALPQYAFKMSFFIRYCHFLIQLLNKMDCIKFKLIFEHVFVFSN